MGRTRVVVREPSMGRRSWGKGGVLICGTAMVWYGPFGFGHSQLPPLRPRFLISRKGMIQLWWAAEV